MTKPLGIHSRALGVADFGLSKKLRLDILAAATSLLDLAAIRSNHLEALDGNRKGQHSIRINDQWRLCFLWKAGDAWNVEIVDYH